jgi:alpha-L-fucosidase
MMMQASRRTIIKAMVAAMSALLFKRTMAAAAAPDASEELSVTPHPIAPGPFEANWESLTQYKTPDWFRDAKFGIWAHWSAQCVPEQGDWYARNMYVQGHPNYEFHVKNYGHPSKFGFMQIDNLWKAQNWDPEALMDLYVKAGAKYFVSLANHHDNFDCYDSTHHSWNSVRVGPNKDIVGTWAKIARSRGLRFGVTNHSSHAWEWFQTAYGYDPEGPLAGVRYDAYTLSKADGAGTWWDGLDPQELYVGRSIVMPNGIKTIKEADEWHKHNDSKWTEYAPAIQPEFVETWYLRCKELVDKYKPDLLYFDDNELPLGQAGLDIAAHFYNSNIAQKGQLEAVLNGKSLKPEQVGAMVLDIERGRSDDILPSPWQTDTCIGNWHYDRSLYEQHRYKSGRLVIQMLADIVSKNGNLLLNIPVRGDGTIDDDERKVLEELAAWMPMNGEAIFGTRPFTIFGEGAQKVKGRGNFNEGQANSYTAEDIRFTRKGSTLYAIGLAWPDDGTMKINTLATGSTHYPGEIGSARLLSTGEDLKLSRDAGGLQISLPEKKPDEFAYVVKIVPKL